MKLSSESGNREKSHPKDKKQALREAYLSAVQKKSDIKQRAVTESDKLLAPRIIGGPKPTAKASRALPAGAESESSQDADPRFPLHETVKRLTADPSKLLSPLQAKMAKQLQGAHFRMINEELYTAPSDHAMRLFSEDPSLFHAYHAGFRLQAKTWPQNPLHAMIERVRKQPKWRVADMGCGEALLAQSVPNKVFSFDLVKANDRITVADISRLPIGSGSVDCAVLCLALMGTNYHDFIREAHRVLVMGGTLLLAEVRSRVDHVLAEFSHMLSELGFDEEARDSSNKMFLQRRPVAAVLSPPPVLKACIYKKR